MESIKKRILQEGRNLGGGILKVDGFINHQVDTALMWEAGNELARRFLDARPTKVLTAEISGIAPALTTALALDVPVIFARKHKPITMPSQVYLETAPSHTKGKLVELMVSPEVISAADRILIVDDFLASGQTLHALVRIVERVGAELVGIGTVIEKSFEGGRELLTSLGIRVESLAVVEAMDDGKIVVAD